MDRPAKFDGRAAGGSGVGWTGLAAKLKPRPVREFADGMDAVSRGDFGAGAAKLAQFADEHPSDARAEEAIYVEAIALERAGRIPEAAIAARRYLGLYPEGAHVTKLRRLAKE